MPRLVLLLLAGLLVLTGCGSSEGGAPGTTQTTTELSAVTVAGPAGSKPTVTFPGVFAVTSSSRKVLTEGTGEEVALGDTIQVNYLGVNGRTGKEFDSSFDPAQPTEFTLSEGSLIKGFVVGLDKVKIGSRVLVAVSPEDGYGPAGGQPSAGIGKDDSLLFVIDVIGARKVLTRAEGTPVAQVPGNPTVTLADDGAPTVVMPPGPPPNQLVIAPLITGTGPPVTAGQKITVHFVVAQWSDGKVLETSWGRGPTEMTVGSGQLIAGLDAALTGQPVGSQVLAVVPQPQGITNPTATASPSATPATPDALVFVVDLLGAS